MELSSSVGLREFPSDRFPGLISFLVPGSHLVSKRFPIPHAAIKALPGKRRAFYVGHIQPASFSRRIGRFKVLRKRKRFLRREGFVKGPRRMGMPVVLNKATPLDHGSMNGDHLFHNLGIIDGSATRSDLPIPPRNTHQVPLRVSS